jgi:hypothetical protein
MQSRPAILYRNAILGTLIGVIEITEIQRWITTHLSHFVARDGWTFNATFERHATSAPRLISPQESLLPTSLLPQVRSEVI